jgi:hypothetical protein
MGLQSRPPLLPLLAIINQAVPDKSLQVAVDDEDVQKAKDFALKEIIKLSDRLSSLILQHHSDSHNLC